MPEIIINAAAGRTQEMKEELMRDITDAVVNNFGVAPDSVVVSFYETPTEHKMRGGRTYAEILGGAR